MIYGDAKVVVLSGQQEDSFIIPVGEDKVETDTLYLIYNPEIIIEDDVETLDIDESEIIPESVGVFFSDVEDLIGVRLTEKFLMVPVKSVSGIYFPTEVKFESCQLCSRKACIGRKAPYNPDLAKKYSEKR